MNLNLKLYLRKGLSLFISAVFLTTNIQISAAEEKNPNTESNQPSYLQKLDLKGFFIPQNLGLLKDSHIASSERLVIHIQDAHAVLEAQKKDCVID